MEVVEVASYDQKTPKKKKRKKERKEKQVEAGRGD
jgi:hypothetical protein